MKRYHLYIAVIAALVAAALTACASAPGTTPAQQALNTTAASCQSIDAAIVAADQALVSGVLKGKNADSTVKGLTAAQAGCVAALQSLQAANAAATPAAPAATPGVSK